MTLGVTPIRSAKGVKRRSTKGVWTERVGLKTLPITSDVSMVWSMEFVKFRVSDNVKLATVVGTVTLHQRYFHNALWLMGSSNGRGVCKIGGSVVEEPFSAGVIDAVNDEHDSNGLTLNSDVGGGLFAAFAFRGWTDLSGDGGNPAFIDTGSTLEFYGRSNLTAVVGAPANGNFPITGLYFRQPQTFQQSPLIPLNWIIFYCTGAGGMTVDRVAGLTTAEIEVRVKCVVTA